MKWIFDLSGNHGKQDFFTEVSESIPHFDVIGGVLKNLQGLVQSLGLLIQNTPSVWRLATAALLLQSVRAGQCRQLSGNYSTIYMNSTQGEGLLAIQYSEPDYVLPALDNVCDFTLVDPPRITYPELACLCEVASSSATTDVSYKVILSGQNIDEDALNCIKAILNENCHERTADNKWNLLIVLGCSFSIWMLGTGWAYAIRYYAREKEREVRPLRRFLEHFNAGSLAVGLIGGLSAYGTGAIKGAQINDFLELFGISAEFLLHPAFLLLVLPVIPSINVWFLHRNENQKALADITGYEFHGVAEHVNLEGCNLFLMSNSLDTKISDQSHLYLYKEDSLYKRDKDEKFCYIIKRCDLFLMSDSSDIKISDQTHLYLYKEGQFEEFYYKIAGEAKKQYLDLSDDEDTVTELKKTAFDQKATPLRACHNERIYKSVLAETSRQGHTQIKWRKKQYLELSEDERTKTELKKATFDQLVTPLRKCTNERIYKGVLAETSRKGHTHPERSIKPIPGQFYIKKNLSLPNPDEYPGDSKNVLSYVTLLPDGETVTEVMGITEQQLQTIIPEMVTDAKFNIDQLRPYFPRILSIAHANGHIWFDYPANRIRQIRQLCRGAYLQFRKEPTSTLLVTLAAVTEAMMVTSSLLKLLGNNKKFTGLAAIIGIFDAIQFILLDGKSLSERLNQNFFYTSPEYESYLNSAGYLRSLGVKFSVHIIPAIGALLYTALAFIETRELIEHMVVSDNEDYKEDMGSIFGLPLALIYGGIQYSLYGYRTQQAIACGIRTLRPVADVIRKWCKNVCARNRRDGYYSSTEHPIQAPPPFRHVKKASAIVVSLVEAITVFSASVSFCKIWNGKSPGGVSLAILAFVSGIPGYVQNYCVEGYELMGIHPEEDHPTESEESARPFSRGGETYPLLPEFLNGMLRLATFTFLRTLIQRTLIPDTVSADEVTYAVTLSSYLCSSTASLATWGIGELILFQALKFHAELHSLSSDEKQTEHAQLTVYRGRQRSETDVSISSTARNEMSPPELNEYETRKYRQAEAHHQFRYSKSRLISQGLTQFITPILIATVLEKSLKRLFTLHSHLDAEESLNNSQTLASLSTGLIVMMLGYLVDYLYGYKDRKLLNHLRELDREKVPRHGDYIALATGDEEKSDNRLTPKAKKLDMAEGMTGYDQYTFCQLIRHLDSKQETASSVQNQKIIGVLTFSDKFVEIELKAQEIKDQKTIATQAHYEYKNEFHLLVKAKDIFESLDELETREKLKTDLQELNNNCSLLLPYYSIYTDDKNQSLSEEYGFLYLTKQQNEIKGICYNPSNNQKVNFHLERYFKKLVSGILMKWSVLRTATPMDPIKSGPWVIMQIQAILNRKIDLIARPHKLVPETNLSSVRLSHFSFLSQLPTVRVPGSGTMEMKPLSHSSSYTHK